MGRKICNDPLTYTDLVGKHGGGASPPPTLKGRDRVELLHGHRVKGRWKGEHDPEREEAQTPTIA